MGRSLIGSDEFTKSLLDRASDSVKIDLCTLCLKGPDRTLAETRHLQPALTCLCLGLLRRFEESGLVPTAVAGHSVGELAALAASRMAQAEDMADIAVVRGKLMTDAAIRPGAMAAVSGGTVEEIQKAIDTFDKPEGAILVIAAVNAPSQLTVSGDSEVVDAFCRRGLSRKLRITPLRVSGAWHSPHMASAIPPFIEAFHAVGLVPASIPLVCNRSGRRIFAPDEAREVIPHQLVRPVRWDLVMRTLTGAGIADFVEIGPGKVLRGLVRLNNTDAEIRVHSLSDLGSLERTVLALSANPF